MSKELSSRVLRISTAIYIAFILTIASIPRVSNFYDVNASVNSSVDITLLVVTVIYCIVSMAVLFCHMAKEESGISFNIQEKLLIAYAMFSIFTTAISRSNGSIQGWLGISTGNGALSIALCVLTVIIIGRSAHMSQLYVVIVSAFLFVQDAIVALQLLGYNPFGLYGSSNFYGDGIATNLEECYAGTLGNIGPLSNILGMITVFLIILVFETNLCKSLRVISAVASVLTSIIVLLLRTQAVVVGFIAAALVAIYSRLVYRGRSTKCLCGIFFECALISVVIVYLFDIDLSLLREVHQILHGNISDDYGSGRIHIWKDFLAECSKNIFVGKGMDSAALDRLGYFVRIDYDSHMIYRRICVDGHSKWINVLYGGGLLTVIPFILYFVSLICALYRKHRVSGSITVLACLSSIVFYVTVWSVSVSYINIDCIFYCFLGVTHTLLKDG